MRHQAFLDIVSSLPSTPGIYKYLDVSNQIIYVGKAKNLKKRVSSYFTKKHENFKTKKLVSEIHTIEFTQVPSEQDAFLLENNLIKQYQPKYNLSLKDDKTYPYLVIKKEPFPRVFFTRRKINDGSQYLGPFTSVENVRGILQLIKQTIPLRSCNLNLSEKNIAKGKMKPCLEYHIGNCKAPCAGLQTLDDYLKSIEQVKQIFKGKLHEIAKQCKQEMAQYAAQMQYEKAAMMKKKLDYIATYQDKSVVLSQQHIHADIVAIVQNESTAYVNYLHVYQGGIIHTHTIEIEKKLNETPEDLLQYATQHLKNLFESESDELVTTITFETPLYSKITIPKSGDKKKLLNMAMHNAQYAMHDAKRKQTLHLQTQNKNQVLEELQQQLRLKELPLHIECFDNSNFQGSYAVAGMVCFKNGIPSKKDYRHYHIKTVSGIDDFASMSEVVYRRYKRLKDENKPMPQLVIIDGGKGQLNAALQSIEALDLIGKFTIIGLAKNVEEIFFPYDTESVKLPYNSETLNLLKNIRNEVHRFAITFHRKKRSKGIVKNELTSIPGIGDKTAQKLLKELRSIQKIKESSYDEIAKIVGSKNAKTIMVYFQKS